MKSLLATLGVVAAINLLAVGGFVAWLGVTDRLSEDRIQQVRVLFQETVTDEANRIRREESAAAAEEAAAAAEAIPAGPAVSSERLLQLRVEASEIDNLRRPVLPSSSITLYCSQKPVSKPFSVGFQRV
ncbi:MAG: hypothetical protein AAF368_13045, partial [Planctomycetota bacterium]